MTLEAYKTIYVQHVLIDTWWNVNNSPLFFIAAYIFVLIDTWWNVNQVKLCSAAEKVVCFNRYMVECE